MYHKGDLRITSACQRDDRGICLIFDNDTHKCDIDDARDNRETMIGEAYLPHSCQEWVIGGLDGITALIEDLTALRDTITGPVECGCIGWSRLRTFIDRTDASNNVSLAIPRDEFIAGHHPDCDGTGKPKGSVEL